MLYQKILTDERPYQLTLSRLSGFLEHRHADIEFNYCVKGSFDVIIDKKHYHVREGEMVLIGSGVSHAFPESSEERLVLTGVVGTSFLKKDFERFSRTRFLAPICDLRSGDGARAELRKTLDEMVTLYKEPSERNDLLLTGDLYRVSAYLLSELEASPEREAESHVDLRTIANVEKALELIYYDYKRALTLEDASAVTGYGKSNFCRIFKRITGTGFHEALNRRRIQIARDFLTETDLSVSAVAGEVGFEEAKTFCRVFRQYEGVTPGTYRKMHAFSERGVSEDSRQDGCNDGCNDENPT